MKDYTVFPESSSFFDLVANMPPSGACEVGAQIPALKFILKLCFAVPNVRYAKVDWMSMYLVAH